MQYADEILLELLHGELVNYVAKTEVKEHGVKEGNLSTLEYFGFNTGFRIIERITKDTPRFKDELETVKYICTELWPAVYLKPIDNLRTNHKGVFVLQDNAFRFMDKISSKNQYLDVAPLYIAFTSGLVRGALANLGINSVVTAEVETMPICKFHIHVDVHSNN
ncbi:trafficking protein particle complex subunit 6B [Cimex lectularius]|uniref:Trafficking protein particle complex subunit 6B n=1 Tax=Cimex lectularius TaxID=79782 RepID=A0A8I6RSM0_CIMLE|nr:trafficking protein particle complex subunit 6B [Cimex lectularius]